MECDTEEDSGGIGAEIGPIEDITKYEPAQCVPSQPVNPRGMVELAELDRAREDHRHCGGLPDVCTRCEKADPEKDEQSPKAIRSIFGDELWKMEDLPAPKKPDGHHDGSQENDGESFSQILHGANEVVPLFRQGKSVLALPIATEACE